MCLWRAEVLTNPLVWFRLLTTSIQTKSNTDTSHGPFEFTVTPHPKIDTCWAATQHLSESLKRRWCCVCQQFDLHMYIYCVSVNCACSQQFSLKFMYFFPVYTIGLWKSTASHQELKSCSFNTQRTDSGTFYTLLKNLFPKVVSHESSSVYIFLTFKKAKILLHSLQFPNVSFVCVCVCAGIQALALHSRCSTSWHYAGTCLSISDVWVMKLYLCAWKRSTQTSMLYLNASLIMKNEASEAPSPPSPLTLTPRRHVST